MLSGCSAGVSALDCHGLLFERTHVDAVDWTEFAARRWPADVQRQHDVTKALETATRVRRGAHTRWRAAIAEALAADVPREVILKAAGGWDVIEVQDILRDLDQRKA